MWQGLLKQEELFWPFIYFLFNVFLVLFSLCGIKISLPFYIWFYLLITISIYCACFQYVLVFNIIFLSGGFYCKQRFPGFQLCIFFNWIWSNQVIVWPEVCCFSVWQISVLCTETIQVICDIVPEALLYLILFQC